MASPVPNVGDWYRLEEGLFEVVAIDEKDATIELQYFDGTVEEMELEEWAAHCDNRAIDRVDAPEDWSGSVDIEPDERMSDGSGCGEYGLRVRSLDDLDLFEAR